MFFKIRKSQQVKSIVKNEREIVLKKDIRDSILSYCNMNHPNEGILIPPFAFGSHSSSGFHHTMLPGDLSYVGTVHSHPSGSATPSVTDLNNFFQLVSLIVRFPYEDDDIFAWDSNGKSIKLVVD